MVYPLEAGLSKGKLRLACPPPIRTPSQIGAGRILQLPLITMDCFKCPSSSAGHPVLALITGGHGPGSIKQQFVAGNWIQIPVRAPRIKGSGRASINPQPPQFTPWQPFSLRAGVWYKLAIDSPVRAA